jgi:two-component system NtrC family response regulator
MRPEVLQCCAEYPWPGNVRELENIIERMVLLAKGSELTAADLPDSIRCRPSDANPPVSLPDRGVSLAAFEKQVILQALKKCGGNQTQAARYLSMSRRTLAYRLEKLGVHGEALKAMKQGTG